MLETLKVKVNELYMTHIVKYGYNHNSYNTKYRAAGRIITEEEMERINHFLKLLPCKNGNVLDIGCGDGSLYDTYMETECYLTLLDISKKMIEKARTNISYANFICDDFLKHKFDRKFEGITLFYSMYHIPLSRQLEALKKMNNLLMPAGVVLLNVRRESSNGYKKNRNWCGSSMMWSYPHLHDFLQMCRDAGFMTSVFPSEDNDDYAWIILIKK